jgi:hypothetical protein
MIDNIWLKKFKLKTFHFLPKKTFDTLKYGASARSESWNLTKLSMPTKIFQTSILN